MQNHKAQSTSTVKKRKITYEIINSDSDSELDDVKSHTNYDRKKRPKNDIKPQDVKIHDVFCTHCINMKNKFIQLINAISDLYAYKYPEKLLRPNDSVEDEFEPGSPYTNLEAFTKFGKYLNLNGGIITSASASTSANIDDKTHTHDRLRSDLVESLNQNNFNIAMFTSTYRSKHGIKTKIPEWLDSLLKSSENKSKSELETQFTKLCQQFENTLNEFQKEIDYSVNKNQSSSSSSSSSLATSLLTNYSTSKIHDDNNKCQQIDFVILNFDALLTLNIKMFDIYHNISPILIKDVLNSCHNI